MNFFFLDFDYQFPAQLSWKTKSLEHKQYSCFISCPRSTTTNRTHAGTKPVVTGEVISERDSIVGGNRLVHFSLQCWSLKHRTCAGVLWLVPRVKQHVMPKCWLPAFLLSFVMSLTRVHSPSLQDPWCEAIASVDAQFTPLSYFSAPQGKVYLNWRWLQVNSARLDC